MTRLVPLGDRAFLACFDNENDAAAWARTVRETNWPGVLDVAPAYRCVGVYVDPEQLAPEELERRLLATQVPSLHTFEGQLVSLPVLYDGADLADVARQLGSTESDVVALHTGSIYRVFALGFLPGFPYSGYLPEPLARFERRSTPRLRVPAGSVAIAGRQTGIYPEEAPGGWHLLGRTPLRIVDLASEFFPIRAGDRIQFQSISRDEFEAREGERLCRSEHSVASI